MLTIRIKLKSGDLVAFADSVEATVGEHLQDIHYIDFYNLRWFVMTLRQKSTAVNIYDPFRPGVNKALNIKININVANTYIKLLGLPCMVWENEYMSAVHYDVLAQIDRQIKNLERIV